MCTCIDVHHHFLTTRYIEELAGIGLTHPTGRPFPDWTIEDSIHAMDRCGIDAALLSLGPPGLPFPDDRQRSEVARSLNEEAAAAVARHPGRLGFFAVLPLPDVDAALEEARHALDTLGADGVGLFSNHRGIYLGDPQFEPLFAELDRRGAVAFIHPTMFTGSDVPIAPTAGSPIPTLPASIIELVFDTTRAVANLLSSGTLARHPNVRLILAHAGGTVPFVAHRLRVPTEQIGELVRQSQTTTSLDEFGELTSAIRAETSAALRSLYYDTAVSATPTVLGALRDLAPASHILAGTDLPFGPEMSARLYLRNMDRLSGLTSAELADNARALFPRWGGS